MPTGMITIVAGSSNPVLEILAPKAAARKMVPLRMEEGRTPDETVWSADLTGLPDKGEWAFRVANTQNGKKESAFIVTSLHTIWLQDGQVFNYCPAAHVSSSRVEKIKAFRGRVRQRPLYIYLPRGYDDHPHRYYPVIYMHDGQNVFETFVQDSFSGSWRADEAADKLIASGQMRECIIVGVSNGGVQRLAEYLPPYITVLLKRRNKRGELPPPIAGRADRMARYYMDDVDAFISKKYRVLPGRENKATLGSSAGGLFTTYLAWDHPDFARHHASLSASYWLTDNQEGTMEMVERMRIEPPRDIRLWLDSGTGSEPYRGGDDDNRWDVLAAHDALIENGYVQGPDFQYFLDEGASHSEAAWAARLPKIFRFLFPVE